MRWRKAWGGNEERTVVFREIREEHRGQCRDRDKDRAGSWRRRTVPISFGNIDPTSNFQLGAIPVISAASRT